MQTKFILLVSIMLMSGSYYFNAYSNYSYSKKYQHITQRQKSINGEAFYKQQCGFCHNKEELLAPDMQKIKAVYIKKYKEKEAFIKAIVNFVTNPDKSKAIYKDGIDNFSDMPKMPFKEAQIKAVAAYIYDSKTL